MTCMSSGSCPSAGSSPSSPPPLPLPPKPRSPSPSPATVASSPPPPPPPPAPPAPPPPASYAVKMAVTIAGNVADFTPAVLTPIRQKVATEASVPLDAVEATATAGSVKIDFTVNMQSEAAATTAKTAITAKLTSPAAAATFLSKNTTPVTVEEIVIPTVLVLVSPPPAPPPLPDVGVNATNSDSAATQDAGPGLAIGLALGGCLLVAVFGAVACIWYHKRRYQTPTGSSTRAPQQDKVTVAQPDLHKV